MKFKVITRFARRACKPCRERSSDGRIFISYRTQEAKAITDYLYSKLNAVFPRMVFRYEGGIEEGVDYRAAIRKELESCYAVLVVIGPTWLTVTDGDGQLRIFKWNDMVRQEVELALAAHGRVLTIPVLVNEARMPESSELPGPIKRLAYRVALPIPPDDVALGARRLIRRLLNPPPPTFAKWADVKLAGPVWLLGINALLRPLWANLVVLVGLIAGSLLIPDGWWLLPTALALWIALGVVTLLDRRQLRCAERWLKAARRDIDSSTLAA
jgi:TIR domain